MSRTPAEPAKRRFYEQALSAAERAAFPEAQQVEGVDEEIAALRLRLRSAIQDEREDVALMLRGMDVLRRLVATRYGLSKADEKALQSAFAAETLRRIQRRGEGDGDDDAA